MAVSERPKLRGFLAASPTGPLREHFVIWCQLNRSSAEVPLTARELVLVQLFDGERTLREIQTAAMGELGGELITVEAIRGVASRLEEAGFLDGPIRPPSCLGSYPSNPRKLRRLLDELFSGPG